MKISGILAAAAATGLFAASAQAAVIDFNMPASLAPTYSQDGFTINNNAPSSEALGNWIAIGAPYYNANGDNPTIFVNYAGTTTTLTFDLGAFDFYSIDLADVYNNGGGGDVLFTFNYAAGGSSSETVTIDNLAGLQTFVFNQTGLSSVEFTAQTTQGPWLQFDFVNTNAAVPEPASWAMMIGGFALMGAAMRRRKAVLAIA